MGLASDSADLAKSPLPMATMAKKVYEDVIESMPELARKDFSSVYKYLERIETKQ